MCLFCILYRHLNGYEKILIKPLLKREGAVKKLFIVIMSVMVLSPLFAEAVTWTGTSNAFTFPTVSTKGDVQTAQAPQAALRCRLDAAKGIVTIGYTLPSIIENATLSICNAGGSIVARFNLLPQTNSVQWNISKNTVAPGVYLATMRYGSVKKMTQISIVK
jgi:hypothetical protein